MTRILEGGCACAKVRYELHGEPMFTHACHCTECRRLCGGPYAINAWTETENVVLKQGKLENAMLGGSGSGKPCETWFCADCGTTVWVRYHVAAGDCRFVKVGTLDDPAAVPPDVHIWTRSKLPGTVLPDDVPGYEKFYDLKALWPAESLARLRANIEAHAPA